MTAPKDPALEAWIDEARAAPIEQPLEQRGHVLRRSGQERYGACPVCGGRDRFSISLRKQVWHCRGCGKGGDVIGLVQHLDSCDFWTACEILTGRPPPDRERAETAEARAARHTALAARDEARRTAEAERARTEGEFRERERRKCGEFWKAALSLGGTPAEAYLARRGLVAPPNVPLRCAPEHPYYDGGGARAKVIHRGPAMLAAMAGSDGAFAALHATWLDLETEKGKVELFDKASGELLPAKKIRGSADRSYIPLVRETAPRRLFIGEGIETVLSVWRALTRLDSPLVAGAAFWAAGSLGNIAGRATASVRHPTLKDAAGRARKVPGPHPDLARPGLPVPDSVTEIWLLGDSDSDRFTAETALQRAARRFHQRGRTTRVVWAPEGEDFNDVLRRAAA